MDAINPVTEDFQIDAAEAAELLNYQQGLREHILSGAECPPIETIRDAIAARKVLSTLGGELKGKAQTGRFKTTSRLVAQITSQYGPKEWFDEEYLGDQKA